jgi:anti-sigma regulatory factor (Ser/Thr protein kinase)
VEFADVAAVGRNPARVIPLLQGFIDQYHATSTGLRGICETAWADRRPEELVECRRSELLLNEAFGDAVSFWLLCPYDRSALGRLVIDDAYFTHPVIDRAGESHASHQYQSGQVALLDKPLPRPPEGAVLIEFSAADLASVRRLATRHALAAGLEGRAADLALAASELATNSVLHADGEGALRLWQADHALVIEVSDRGHRDDLLVGRRRPARGQPGGRGLWLVNQVSDLVQIRSPHRAPQSASTSGTDTTQPGTWRQRHQRSATVRSMPDDWAATTAGGGGARALERRTEVRQAPRLLTPRPTHPRLQATGPTRPLPERLRQPLSPPEEPGQRHAGERAGVPGSSRAYAAHAAGDHSGTTGPPDRPRTPERLARDPCTHSPPNRSETRRTSTRGRRRDDRSYSRRARLSGRTRRSHSSSRLDAGLHETPGRPRFIIYRRLARSSGLR